MSIKAPASTGSRGSFSVFFSGCMQVVVLYPVIKKPLTTNEFAVICRRIENGGICGAVILNVKLVT
jgi:hypothetical protein